MTNDLEAFLKEMGLREAAPQPKPKPERIPDRDVSWFARGEECPH